MIVACLSDIHGNLVDPVRCDLAIVAGDITPPGTTAIEQLDWLRDKWCPWVETWRNPVVFVSGNHDRVFRDFTYRLPKFPSNAHYLECKNCNPFRNEFQIFGSPYSLPYGRSYAFMASDSFIKDQLEPGKGCTILVSHAPPKYLRDRTEEGLNAGSKSVSDFIEDHRPILTVCGHIHEARGIARINSHHLVVNASMTSNRYKVIYAPMIVEVKWDLGNSGSADLLSSSKYS